MQHSDQILTVAQMRDAENYLIAQGASVDALMHIAGRGAAEWVWRIAAQRPVTVLCGPGNNGGDGYVIAQAILERGGHVTVIAASEPRTEACRNARDLFQGDVFSPEAGISGEVFVDCLFGCGLSRSLSPDHSALIRRLSASHQRSIAVDVPSGVQSDTGMILTDLPVEYDLTLALGAWKFAHFLMPSSPYMGTLRLVGIGVDHVEGAGTRIAKPKINAPSVDAHKYRRGLLAVVGGDMPGAAVLAASAAQRAGAGYVKLFAETVLSVAPDLIVDTGRLSDVLTDDRNSAVLVGPGLGRHAKAREKLAIALADPVPAVVDADALVLLSPRLLAEREHPVVATPHDGEFIALERAFELNGEGSRVERSLALAAASGMVIVAKGPDTLVAAPDGRLACSPRGSSWLSTAGAGDVLAGLIASRVANGVDAFTAACEGVWLHSETARVSPPAFTAGQLVEKIPDAIARCL